MKRFIRLMFMIVILAFTSCAGCEQKDRQIDEAHPTITTEIKEEANIESVYYTFDVSKEWDASEYKEECGQEINYFSAPILSPYKYTYICETSDMSINKIANALGVLMMEDFMRDYEGKSFIVTEYKNLVEHVMNEDELTKWKEDYSKLGKKVVILENQWLCTYSCDYKYTGEYAGIGEMPLDLEWTNTLVLDGSGENYVFIIQKNSKDEYIMRGMPKTVMEAHYNQED